MEDKEKRKKRNARYYFKRKSKRVTGENRTLKKAEGTQVALAKVIPLRTGDASIDLRTCASPKRSLTQILSASVLMLLVIAMTIFLVHETYCYFSDAEGEGIFALLKAILCEGIILSLSLASSDQLATRVFQKILVVGMCCYSLWAISGGVISHAFQEWGESKTAAQLIFGLETQIREKQKLLDTYLTRDWVSAARTTQKELDVLNHRLTELRLHSVKLKSPQVILNSVLNLVVFRLLVLLANILSIRRLRDYFMKSEGILFRTILEMPG